MHCFHDHVEVKSEALRDSERLRQRQGQPSSKVDALSKHVWNIRQYSTMKVDIGKTS